MQWYAIRQSVSTIYFNCLPLFRSYKDAVTNGVLTTTPDDYFDKDVCAVRLFTFQSCTPHSVDAHIQLVSRILTVPQQISHVFPKEHPDNNKMLQTDKFPKKKNSICCIHTFFQSTAMSNVHA
jgi:hypothetical protein